MKKILTTIFIVFMAFVGIKTYFFDLDSKIKKIPLKDRMDLAWAQEREMTLDPATGEVPKERLLQAYKYKESLVKRMALGKGAITGINWQERGPSNCGGRVRSVCVDLIDATGNTLWAGSVAGGLWKTADINSTNPSWTPVNDFFENLAITYIEQSVTNPLVMYFCTGEGNNNSDAVRGLGVWKTTDGGVNWTQLASTNNSNFHYCQKVFCPSGPDTVFVATKTGLYRSVNGGTSFSRVLGSGISSAGGNIAYDIERNSNGTLIATTSGTGSNSGTIHKSFDNGATWTTPLTWPSTVLRREIEIGLPNNDTNTIWCLVENGGTITAVVKSTNGGTSFSATAAYPDDADTGIPNTDFSRGQAWYDLSIAVDPNNANVCVVGGIDLFKTSDGGVTWNQISHWYGGFGFQEVHADQHYAVFAPNSSSVCYFANDGGVYRSTNFNSSNPTISSKESNLNTTQFYACAIHPTSSNYFLAGAQDNGSHKFTSTGINQTDEVTGGDGAFCHIDQNQAQFQYTSYVYNNYYRSSNSGASFNSVINNNSGRFINPTDYDDVNNILYGAEASGKFFRWNNPQTGSTTSSVSFSSTASQVTAVKVSPNVSNRVYFGFTGKIVRVDNANTGTSVTETTVSTSSIPGSGYISCIEVEVGNENHIICSISNYGLNSVWETTNGGTSWISVEGNLPDMPIRWVVFHPQSSIKALVATELGVWSTDTLKGTSTNWAPSNSGLANVRVDMLQVRTLDNLVAAATHARGLFTATLPNIGSLLPVANFSQNKTFSYPNTSIQFTNTSLSSTSYLWNFGDGTTSTQVNPTKSYLYGGNYTVSLTASDGSLSSVKTITIKIMPHKAIPFTLSNGGNFETNATDFYAESGSASNFVRGNSTVAGKNGTNSGSFAWVIDPLNSSYTDNATCYLYTPTYNMTQTGTYGFNFRLKNNLEIGYDGLTVEYSLNGGNTWLSLGTTVLTNWYDFANTGTGTAFPTNQAFFNATNSSFSLKTYNISTLAGNNNVAFRFVFKSDASATAPGLAIDDFEITGPVNNSLPVLLQTFFGQRLNEKEVKLYWQTVQELNNKGFEIQRTFDLALPWNSIGLINGANNSNKSIKYSYTDLNANGNMVYYRLKQIDFDGKYTYSKVVRVSNSNKQNKMIDKLIPVNHQKVFSISYIQKETLTLQIINSSGQIVRFNNSFNEDEIDFNGLASGIYFVSFKNNAGNTQVEKVLVY